jgi:glycosyltransferase involved in cell wall biosynthesis
MKIGLYANIKCELVGGVQQYIEKITLALIQNPFIQLFVITNEDFYNHFFKNINTRNIHIILVNGKYQFEIKDKIYDLKLDLLHFPFQYIPFGDWKIPTLITLHDLQHEYFPEFFTKDQLDFRNYYYKKSALLCDQIIVSFNHVKEDIHKFYNIPYEKISVTSLGYENRFKEQNLCDKDLLTSKFNIPEHFILYPAQTWRHKNHVALFKAIKILRDKYQFKITLICTGALSDYYELLQEYIKENELTNQIKFLGFVTIDELYSLYYYTDLVVIPTLYEAGSFPLLEAMSLEKPVICSNVTSLPDTIGDLRFTFNPNDSEQIANSILNMLTDKNLILINKRNSKTQIRRFNWEDVCKNFIQAYKKAIINFNEGKYNKDYFKELYLKERQSKIEDINKEFDTIAEGEKVVIYAAGEHTMELIKQTNISDKNIQYIVDKKLKGSFFGYEVRAPEQIMVSTPDVVVISSFSFEDEIFDYIRTSLNFKGRVIKLYNNADKKPFFNL